MILYHRHPILEKGHGLLVTEESKKSKMSRVYLSLMEEPKDILATGGGSKFRGNLKFKGSTFTPKDSMSWHDFHIYHMVSLIPQNKAAAIPPEKLSNITNFQVRILIVCLFKL